jgi:hypothetical protein
MKTLITLCVTLLSAASFSQVIFSEDFNSLTAPGTLPAAWTVIDNDGLTVVSNVAYVSSAWVVQEATPGDNHATSTSWYSPPGQSDDWMITPPINVTTTGTLLEFDAMAPDPLYSDGYEVWVSTGAPTVAGMTAGTMVLSVAAEASIFTNHVVDISAFDGMNVYIGWRNTSLDKFLLHVDSVIVTGSAADVAVEMREEYSIFPMNHLAPIGATAMIYNVDAFDVTNATLNVTIYDGLMTSVYTGSSAPASILSGDSLLATVPGYTPSVVDVYTVEQVVTITEADVNIMNDTSYYQVAVTPATYGRDDSQLTLALGLGAGAIATLGQNYDIINPDVMESVTFFYGAPVVGDTTRVSVYSVVAGTPTTLIGQSVEYIIQPTDTVGGSVLLTLDVSNLSAGALALTPGEYYVGAEEYNSTANMGLGMTDGFLTLNKVWGSINGGLFGTLESFGFPGAFVLRPNFVNCVASADSITVGACLVYTAPSGATYNTTGIFMDTIPNACGADSVITINLTIGTTSTATVNESVCSSYIAPSGAVFSTTGTYTDTIPNSCGGDSIITINLIVGANTTASVTVTECSLYTAPSGAIFTTTGTYTDTIPNSCGGDSIITINLIVGANTTASVTVTECSLYTAPSGATFTTTGTYTDVIPNACGGDSIITINLTVPVLDLSVTMTGATLTSGGSLGYAYQWIDCATLASIAGEISQAFTATVDGDYAVIITDGACSDTSACTAVLVGGLNDIVAIGGLEIYPNPSNGDFTVNIVGITADAVNIEVIDFSGRIVEARTFNNVQKQLTATMNVNAEAGSYLVRISANGETTIQTIVISK